MQTLDLSPSIPLHSLCYRDLDSGATNIFYATASGGNLQSEIFPGFAPGSATELLNWVVEVQFFARKNGHTSLSLLSPAGDTMAYRRMPNGGWIEAQLFTLMEAMIDG